MPSQNKIRRRMSNKWKRNNPPKDMSNKQKRAFFRALAAKKGGRLN